MKKIRLTQVLVSLTNFGFLLSTSNVANSQANITNPNNPNSAITHTFNKENTAKLTNEDVANATPIETTQSTKHLDPINTEEIFKLDQKTAGVLFVKHAEDNKFYGCTASSMDSPNKNSIITAAHCLVRENEKGEKIFPDKIIYAPGYF